MTNEGTHEVMPTEHDQAHISLLAELLIETAQEYARDNEMSFPGVVSAIGTMAGALLARAYHSPDLAKEVAMRLSTVAVAMVEIMHKHDSIVVKRKQ